MSDEVPGRLTRGHLPASVSELTTWERRIGGGDKTTIDALFANGDAPTEFYKLVGPHIVQVMGELGISTKMRYRSES